MLKLCDVMKSFGEFALGPVDLTVDEEVLAILGPSGCGKTTLLSTVAGVVAPDDGRVVLDGTDLTGRPIERRGTAFLFQDGALFPHMTARENVEYAAASESRICLFADIFELHGMLDRRPPTLSGGERQRVALARALAADPDVLLLDEPLSSLDVPIRRRLREEIRDVLAGLAIPVVYVTHDREEAAVVGDSVAVMRDGEVLQIDDPETVFRRPATPFVASFTGNDNLFEARVADAADGRLVLDWDGRRVLVTAEAVDATGAVGFCVRPEYVTLRSGTTDRPNEFDGWVETHRFEGTSHRVTVALDGDRSTLEAVVSPATCERLAVEPERSVVVHLPPDAVHVVSQ